MLQRIQTVYLALAVIALMLVFFVDVAHFTDPSGIESQLNYYSLNKANGETSSPELGLLPVSILSITAALLFVSITRFRNRDLQRKLVRFSYILILLSVIATWYFVDQNYWVLEIQEPDLTYHVGFYLPFVAFAFAFLANRSIKKDEELIKSLDRIR